MRGDDRAKKRQIGERNRSARPSPPTPLPEYRARGAKIVDSISPLEVTLRIPNYLLNLPKSPPFRQARAAAGRSPASVSK